MSTVKSSLDHKVKIQKTTMRRFVYYFFSSFLLCLGSGVIMVSSYSILSRNTRRSSFSLSSVNNENNSIDSSSSSSFLVDTINTTSVATAEDASFLIPTEKDNNARNTATMASTDDDAAKLHCRVMGYYPFPKTTTTTTNSQQLFGIGRFWKWLLKDTHQAIIITQQQQQQQQETIKVRIDFMTKGGANHPVWYNEIVKWHVWLGGTIDGEIRIKVMGGGAEQRRRRQQRGTTLSTPSSTVAYSPTMLRPLYSCSF